MAEDIKPPIMSAIIIITGLKEIHAFTEVQGRTSAVSNSFIQTARKHCESCACDLSLSSVPLLPFL